MARTGLAKPSRAASIGLLASNVLSVTVVGMVASGARRAHAEPSADDKAAATVLFEEGRKLMAAGRVAEACPKLEESQRLDPGGGTLLNLALCHEQEGRLARAWSEFKEAAMVARRSARRDREVEARRHVDALEPRLSRLTIVVPAGSAMEGLVIERDGHQLGPGAWSTAIPVDRGPHVVRASAPGREPYTTTIVVDEEAEEQTVEIPALAAAVVAAPPLVTSRAAPLPLTPPAAVPPAPTRTSTRLRWAGIGTAGVGVLLLGTAGYALATALSKKNEADADCFVDGCNDVGLQKRRDAVSRGNLATMLGIGGAVLVATGGTLLYLGRRTDAHARQQASLAMRFTLGAAPGVVMVGVGGGL